MAAAFYRFPDPIHFLATFWDRPDPLLIAATSLALAALVVPNRRGAVSLLGIALGLAISAKIHGFLYLLPVCVVWLRRYGFRSLFTIFVIGGIIAILPFLLPGISLNGYLGWLRLAAGHSIIKHLLADNLSAFVILLIPLVFLPRSIDVAGQFRSLDESTLLFLSLVGTGLLVCMPASKAGAGAHHLLPLTPYVGYLWASTLAAHTPRDRQAWGLGIGFLWLISFYSQMVYQTRPFWLRYRDGVAAEAVADLRTLLTRYNPQDLQMGCGGERRYPLTFYSPWIYQDGAPRVVDTGSCMDMKESGLSLRPLENSLRERTFRIWLIPRDDKPFSIISYYDAKPLFDDSVAEAFLRNYSIVESTRYYDVYQANAPSL